MSCAYTESKKTMATEFTSKDSYENCSTIDLTSTSYMMDLDEEDYYCLYENVDDKANTLENQGISYYNKEPSFELSQDDDKHFFEENEYLERSGDCVWFEEYEYEFSIPATPSVDDNNDGFGLDDLTLVEPN